MAILASLSAAGRSDAAKVNVVRFTDLRKTVAHAWRLGIGASRFVTMSAVGTSSTFTKTSERPSFSFDCASAAEPVTRSVAKIRSRPTTRAAVQEQTFEAMARPVRGGRKGGTILYFTFFPQCG
jgi:hypothetical protein